MCEIRFAVFLLLIASNSVAVSQNRAPLLSLLDRSERIDEIALLVLSENDLSEEGVILSSPIASWIRSKSPGDKSLAIRILANDSVRLDAEATLTNGREVHLVPIDFGVPPSVPPGSILILAREASDERTVFQLRIVEPTDKRFIPLLQQVGFEPHAAPRKFAILRRQDAIRELDSTQLRQFLQKFDVIRANGFVKTMRRGSTGIGFTLETLLGLEENNDPTGDFLGMELKAYRDAEGLLDDTEKMNLFLKEPKWLDGLRSAERIQQYGYKDDNGRTALYSTVTIAENSHGFRFKVDEANQRLQLLFKSKAVGEWAFATLQKRLTEKHSQAVFVAAETRGRGANEEFRYHTVTWCARPAVGELLRLIRTGDAMLELRMHVKENGSARNHGSAFRVQKKRLTELYAATVKCRVDQPKVAREPATTEP